MRSKIYGIDQTELMLTQKAQKAYRGMDPLTIEEYDTTVGKRYMITGCIFAIDFTADMVNETLEYLVDCRELHVFLGDLA